MFQNWRSISNCLFLTGQRSSHFIFHRILLRFGTEIRKKVQAFMTIANEPKLSGRVSEPGRLGRAIFRQSAAIAFGVAVVAANHPREWVAWQQAVVFLMAWDLMSGTIALITPEVRLRVERTVWRGSRGFSAVLCGLHVHPWIVPLFFPALHDFRFALGLHGGCVASAALLHRLPAGPRAPLAAVAAGLAVLAATQRGVPEGFGWMALAYPANCILCWWLPACGVLEAGGGSAFMPASAQIESKQL